MSRHVPCLPPPGHPVPLEAKGRVTFGAIARVLFHRHRRRSILALSLMVAQAFAYNGVFFTYALVLSKFYGVVPRHIGLYLIPFALGNLLGPLVLGVLFDRLGRRRMIAATYGTSGLLIALTGYGLVGGWFDATTQTAMWCVVFFVASAAASSAYLTVSELFPVELRGMAIALFYAIGTATGGVAAPWLFGALLETGSRGRVFIGYLVGAALMCSAGVDRGVSRRRRRGEIARDAQCPARPRGRTTGGRAPCLIGSFSGKTRQRPLNLGPHMDELAA